MQLGFILFLTVVLAFLFGMHYAFFRSIVCFFDITRPLEKIFIYTAMTALTFSFISAFMLLHRYPNDWTIWYYRITAGWTGLLINLVLAVGATWLIVGVARVTGYAIHPKKMVTIFLTGALLFSIWGLWRAFHPEIREIDIPIGSRSGKWQDYRIVQLSDVHLGFLRGKAFADRMVDRVNALDPDLIMVTGDLFDGIGGFYDAFIEPLNRLKARRGIFFVTGNHEHYAGIGRTLAVIGKTNITILDNETVDINGLQVIGVSYPGIRHNADIAGLADIKPSDAYRILLFHTPTSILLPSSGQKSRHVSTYWMPDTSYDHNRQLGVDLQLSGHTHYGQIFPFNLITRLLYRGNDYGLKRHGALLLYTSSGVGTWGPPLRTAGKSEIVLIRFRQIDADP
jgi:predicted MPP superfamily phosphohydrolase